MYNKNRKCMGFTLVELVMVITVISMILGFILSNANARLDHASVERDLAEIETLLGAGKALWARKVDIRTENSFSSTTVPAAGANLCDENNCANTLIANNEIILADEWLRFDLSEENVREWLNDSDQLSGLLPANFSGTNHQGSPYHLILKEHLIEVSTCFSQETAADTTYLINPNACRENNTLMEMRRSTNARNARLAF